MIAKNVRRIGRGEEESNRCHSSHKQSARCPKKQPVLPVQPTRKGMCTCTCGMSWGPSMKMKPLPTYFLTTDNQQKRHGAWHWSRSFSLRDQLSDRQAADAVRGRIDIKYALSGCVAKRK